MLNKIIQYSLDNRMLIIFLSLMLVIGGLFTARNMEIDVFPDLTAPTVVVLTDAHGMAAEEVEALVTFPIESSLNGATDVRRVRSSSSYGFSIVWVEFDWDTDIYRARQIVSEKLPTIAALLPKQIEAPIIAPQTSVMGEVMLVSLTSDSLSMFDLRTITDKQVRQRLLSVTGVAQVVVIGGLPKQYQILVDPHKMKYHDISLEDLISTAENTNSNAAGGIINQYGQEYAVRATGRSTNPSDIGSAVIRIRNGKPVKIADVAEVKIGHPDRVGDAWLDMEPAVILTILKQPNVNTLTLTSEVESALAELQSTLPEDVQINSEIFRQADFINTAVSNVFRVLLEGGLFVSIILFLFLLNVRTTLISLVAIPLSLMLSLITLKLLGLTINTMSLGGMAIAIGALVDDAIIVVENTQRHMASGLAPVEATKTAMKEIGGAVIATTLVLLAVFVPLAFVPGLTGELFRQFSVTISIAVAISSINALTLSPALCATLLKPDSGTMATTGPFGLFNRGFERMTVGYTKWVKALIRRSAFFMLLFALFIGLTVFLFGRMPTGFVPLEDQKTFMVDTQLPEGASLLRTEQAVKEVEDIIRNTPGVAHIISVPGYSLIKKGITSNGALSIVVMDHWDERGDPALSEGAVVQSVRPKLDALPCFQA